MPYCTSADVEQACGGAARLLQLLDRDGDGNADTSVVDDAIAEAGGMIDGYAQKRFAVPFTAPSETIKRLAARLARYALREQKGAIGPSDIRANDADLKWLKALADGEVLPGGDVVPAKSPIVNDKTIADTGIGDLRAAWRDSMKGFG